MRVFLLAPHPFFIERGTPIDVDLLLRALGERGETVDAIVYPGGRERENPNVTVHRVSDSGRLKRPPPPGLSLTKLYLDLIMCFRAWRLMRTHRYDVIHANEEMVFVAALLSRWYRVPFVYDMDSSIAQQLIEQMPGLRPLARCFDWLEGWATRRAAAVAPVCDTLADRAEEHGAKHIVTLHDISQMSDSDFEATGELRAKIDTDDLLLVYVGNLQPYQGVDLLLEAFAHARLTLGARVELVIAGGEQAGQIDAYRAKAARLGVSDETHLIGHWPNDRLGVLLAEADILVSPRIRGVNTPMKVFPYLHSARPVLVTDLPTHSRAITRDAAMFADPEPQPFGEAIATLASDSDLRDRLGRAGRALAIEKHTYPAHRERVDRLYDFLSTLGRAPSGSAGAARER